MNVLKRMNRQEWLENNVQGGIQWKKRLVRDSGKGCRETYQDSRLTLEGDEKPH